MHFSITLPRLEYLTTTTTETSSIYPGSGAKETFHFSFVAQQQKKKHRGKIKISP
jgi:hypothetical protein